MEEAGSPVVRFTDIWNARDAALRQQATASEVVRPVLAKAIDNADRVLDELAQDPKVSGYFTAIGHEVVEAAQMLNETRRTLLPLGLVTETDLDEATAKLETKTQNPMVVLAVQFVRRYVKVEEVSENPQESAIAIPTPSSPAPEVSTAPTPASPVSAVAPMGGVPPTSRPPRQAPESKKAAQTEAAAAPEVTQRPKERLLIAVDTEGDVMVNGRSLSLRREPKGTGRGAGQDPKKIQAVRLAVIRYIAENPGKTLRPREIWNAISPSGEDEFTHDSWHRYYGDFFAGEFLYEGRQIVQVNRKSERVIEYSLVDFDAELVTAEQLAEEASLRAQRPPILLPSGKQVTADKMNATLRMLGQASEQNPVTLIDVLRLYRIEELKGVQFPERILSMYLVGKLRQLLREEGATSWEIVTVQLESSNLRTGRPEVGYYLRRSNPPDNTPPSPPKDDTPPPDDNPDTSPPPADAAQSLASPDADSDYIPVSLLDETRQDITPEDLARQTAELAEVNAFFPIEQAIILAAYLAHHKQLLIERGIDIPPGVLLDSFTDENLAQIGIVDIVPEDLARLRQNSLDTVRILLDDAGLLESMAQKLPKGDPRLDMLIYLLHLTSEDVDFLKELVGARAENFVTVDTARRRSYLLVEVATQFVGEGGDVLYGQAPTAARLPREYLVAAMAEEGISAKVAVEQLPADIRQHNSSFAEIPDSPAPAATETVESPTLPKPNPASALGTAAVWGAKPTAPDIQSAQQKTEVNPRLKRTYERAQNLIREVFATIVANNLVGKSVISHQISALFSVHGNTMRLIEERKTVTMHRTSNGKLAFDWSDIPIIVLSQRMPNDFLNPKKRKIMDQLIAEHSRAITISQEVVDMSNA